MTRVSDPGRTRIAVAMAMTTAGCLSVAFGLTALAPADRVAEITSIRTGEAATIGLTFLAFAIVGAIIVRHQPDNAVGWLCGLSGFLISLVALASGIGTYALATDPGSRIGVAAAWLAHVGSLVSIGAPLFILMRFPTGRPLGPGSKRAEVLTIGCFGVFAVLLATDPTPMINFPTTDNPLGLGQTSRLTGYGPILIPLAAVPGVAVVGTLVLRYRRGSTLERRQLRWLGVAAGFVCAAVLGAPLTSPELLGGGRNTTLSAVVYAIAYAAIPVSIGIAIVRDRLYDIDVIVKRTLVYGAVSAILAAVYVAGVVALQAPLGRIVPGDAQTLATAGSTLLVAALFRPVRGRAQRTIDRRFDRERYEAAITADAFAGQVRGEVELGAIVGHLVDTARRTVHPTAAACWVRPSAAIGRARVLGYNRRTDAHGAVRPTARRRAHGETSPT